MSEHETTADPGFERRDLFRVAGGAAVTAAALGAFAARGPAEASAPAARATVAAGGPSDPRLKGPYIDLTTPRGNMIASARLHGNLDMAKTKYGYFSGTVMGVVPGQPVKDLVLFEGFSCAKLLPHESGTGYRKVLREVGLYRDLKTGEVLEEWVNPYTNEKVRVVPVANDPFNHTIEEFYPDPPNYGGLNTAKPPRRPYLLNWQLRNNTLNLWSHIHLFYPSALQPDKWPRESAGKMAQVSEMFAYFIDPAAMQNEKLTSVEYEGSWSRITPWLPWMLMGQAPGNINYYCFMGAVDDFERLPIDKRTVEYVRAKYPKYLEAPDKWVEPSLSSLENYAREQKPAPAKS